MHTTELIRPPAASTVASDDRTFGEMLAETIPLVGAIAGYGPPVIFLAGPWLFLGLMLAAPFAVLVTLIAFMVAAATVLVALTAVIVGVPYLLVRRLRSYRERRASSTGRSAQLVPVRSTRVAA
jgi:hypothetical protein